MGPQDGLSQTKTSGQDRGHVELAPGESGYIKYWCWVVAQPGKAVGGVGFSRSQLLHFSQTWF